jgi:hypothetical protein
MISSSRNRSASVAANATMALVTAEKGKPRAGEKNE